MSTPNNTSGRFVVSLDFLKKGLGDCIPDERMQEIVKRLVAVLPESFERDIVRSESAPQDRTKLWYVPSSKKLYVFNTSTSQWEETNVDNFTVCLSEQEGNALEKDEAGCLFLSLANKAGTTEYFDGIVTTSGSGTVTKTLTYDTLEDEFANVTVAFRDDPGTSGRWWISDQSETSVTINFAGLSNSTDYRVRIAASKHA